MHWNYRLVNTPSENGGEDWFELKEVYYNEDNSLMGYADPCLGTETIAGIPDLAGYFAAAFAAPPLHENDFKDATFPNEDGEGDWRFPWGIGDAESGD